MWLTIITQLLLKLRHAVCLPVPSPVMVTPILIQHTCTVTSKWSDGMWVKSFVFVWAFEILYLLIDYCIIKQTKVFLSLMDANPKENSVFLLQTLYFSFPTFGCRNIYQPNRDTVHVLSRKSSVRPNQSGKTLFLVVFTMCIFISWRTCSHAKSPSGCCEMKFTALELRCKHTFTQCSLSR